jgi:hypothetical protein
MNEVNKLNMVRDYWKHADEGLRDEFAQMPGETWIDN